MIQGSASEISPVKMVIFFCAVSFQSKYSIFEAFLC